MDIFTRFKQALKIREVLVDNNVFQLHYRVTALMLLCCAGLVASKQHFGDPIDCITRDDVPNKIMDTYCWIHATFTLPGACNKTVGVEVAHPCVDKSSAGGNEERVYHKYYQWVYFVLFFQAAFFYAPHFFWKSFEGGLLKTLTTVLQDPLYQKEEEKKLGQAKNVIKYLNRRRGQHQNYYFYFALFEVANLLNVLIQIYVVDEFLGGTFTTYGLDVLRYASLEQDDRVDPMVRVFPRMTKCAFHRFGSSGDVQKYDALCILPLNIINEKIYIIMWFWFVFLACVTSCWLIYRLLTFFKPDLRFEVLKRRASLTSSHQLKVVLRNSQSGDWFLLCMMCKNMDSQWFRYIITKLAQQIKRDAEQRRQRNGFNKPNSNKFHNRGRLPVGGGDAKELILAGNESTSSDGDDDDDDDDFSDSNRSDQGDDDQAPLSGVTVESAQAAAAASGKGGSAKA